MNNKETEINFELPSQLSNLSAVFESLLTVGSEDEKSKVHLVVFDIENIIPLAKISLEKYYLLNPENRKETYEHLKGKINYTEQLLKENNVSFLKERLRFLEIIKTFINEIFSSNSVDISSSIKIKFNAPKNVLYDLFKQLKNKRIEGNISVLSQTNLQLAEFIVRNFEGFENISIETVTNELSRDQVIKKDRLEIK